MDKEIVKVSLTGSVTEGNGQRNKEVDKETVKVSSSGSITEDNKPSMARL